MQREIEREREGGGGGRGEAMGRTTPLPEDDYEVKSSGVPIAYFFHSHFLPCLCASVIDGTEFLSIGWGDRSGFVFCLRVIKGNRNPRA